MCTFGTKSLPTLQLPRMYLLMQFQQSDENELKLNSSQCATYSIRRTIYALRTLRETCCEFIRRRGTLARLRRQSITSIIKYHSRAGKKRRHWFPLAVSHVYLYCWKFNIFNGGYNEVTRYCNFGIQNDAHSLSPKIDCSL